MSAEPLPQPEELTSAIDFAAALGAKPTHFETWCNRLWQTHHAGHGPRALHEHWPTPEDFHEHWPLLAEDLVVADWKIDGASTDSVFDEIDLEILDPPRVEVEPWQVLYAPELDEHVGVSFDMLSPSPVAALARRARLTPAETDVLRAWAAGSSLRSTARALGKQVRTVRTLLDRAIYRLQQLDRRRLVAHPTTSSVGDPCSSEPTSPAISSPDCSAMPKAS